MKTRLKRQTFVTLTALIALLAISIACGTETQNNQGSEVTPVTAKALSKESSSTALPVTEAVNIISVDGSSTVFPVTEAVAEEYYIKTNGEIPVTVGVSGTGGGMKKFCRGETHISNASRPQKEKERILCEEGGFTSVELPVAIDGLTVVVNKENDFVDCMTVAQLNTIWDPSSEGKITMWNQVDPSWPAEKMELYGPGQDSGTFDYFTETVNGESQASRGDFTASEDDNVLVTGVSGDKYALAYFGYAYFAENADKLKAIEIVNDQGNCVAPEAAAINSGEYNPLSRPLFIYVRGDVATVEPVKSFVEFYLSSAGRALVGEVGYVAYPDEVYELALGRLQSANTQLLWGGDNPKSGGVLERLKNNQGSEVTPKALSSSTALPVTEAVKIISVDGSSTVFPVTEAVAEEYYIKTNGEIPVTVGVSGTGGGMKKFCRGETHISNASRPQKEKERILCEEGGFTSVELPVAIDGLTVVVNKENDFVDCMTVAQLNTIWDPSSEGKITMWNQVDPSWPAEKMELYGPGQDSGTFDYFTETVNGESQASRGDFTASEDDNVLVTGVSGDKYALAYFGYAYFAENADKLKAIEIVNDQGNCVAPEAAAINSGEYNPLSRPLFIYVRGDVATVEPVKSFVEFYLSSAGRALVGEVGYVAYPDEVYELALGRLQSANTQLLWGGDNPKSGGVLERLKNNQ